MRIGIDASCWANRRGYGRYTRELIQALLARDDQNAYTLFLDAATERLSSGLPERVRRVIVPARSAAAEAAAADGHRSLRDLWAMSRAVARESRELDLFYFPSVYTFFPVPRRLTTLTTIHDTTPERHPKMVFRRWHNRLFWNIKVAWAIRQARLILTVSETARFAITEHFHLADSRVRVVPDAVSPEFRPSEDTPERRAVLASRGMDHGQRFLLYVGGMSPHKRLDTLIDAHAQLIKDAEHRDLKLALVGDYERDVFFSSYSSLRNRAGQSVIFTGFIPDSELRHWYSAAAALVLPSVDEGFGLPVVEAMACDTPVVASRAGALPEVVANAGLLFEPGNAFALTEALKSLLGDATLRQTLVLRGRERARRYTWQASARALAGAFESVRHQSA